MTSKIKTKTFSKILRSGVLCLLATAGNFKADLEVSASVEIHSASDFDAPLSSVGTWVEVPRHGRCWRPTSVEVGWRPYSSGRWVWTDLGWYWESEEPWGWACYHYGNWAYDDGYGWVWVPAVEWAPAWVVWRTSETYVGWAPLAPAGWFAERVPPPTRFVFIESRRFTEPVRPTVIVAPSQTIISHTVVINNVRREERNFEGRNRHVVVNTGPGIDPFQRMIGHTIAPTPIREVASRVQAPAEIREHQRTDRNQRENRTQPTQTREATQAPQPNASKQYLRATQPTATPAPTQPSTTSDQNVRQRDERQPLTPSTPSQFPREPRGPKERTSEVQKQPVVPSPPSELPQTPPREHRELRPQTPPQREIPTPPQTERGMAPEKPTPPAVPSEIPGHNRERSVSPPAAPSEIPAERPGRSHVEPDRGPEKSRERPQ